MLVRCKDGRERKLIVLNTYGHMTFGRYDSTLPSDIGEAMNEMQMFANHPNLYPVVLFEGGGDIHPSIYGQPVTYSYVGKGQSHRDRREIDLYNFARSLKLPILGICRGHQLIAALEGGSLYQDFEIELGLKDKIHIGNVQACGFFTNFRDGNWRINHLHHQAIKDVPSNAQVIGRCEVDDVIEACYYSHERMFTVQWHPELMQDFEFLQYVCNVFEGNHEDGNRN